MAKMKALVCRECGKEYLTKAIHVCEMCFGPLEVKYNYTEVKQVISRQKIEDGPQSMWRYADLLPVEGTSYLGPHAGLTPLVRAKNLGAYLGIDELYIKNDTVNHPTLSFKDRVVAVALTRARELGFETVACASTGNLANSVAAHAAAAGMRCYVFIPSDLEAAKVLGNLIYKPTVVEVEGNYDDVNRLCSEIAGEHGWAFVNINIRPYYAEGSKTLAFETVEQLGIEHATATQFRKLSGQIGVLRQAMRHGGKIAPTAAVGHFGITTVQQVRINTHLLAMPYQ